MNICVFFIFLQNDNDDSDAWWTSTSRWAAKRDALRAALQDVEVWGRHMRGQETAEATFHVWEAARRHRAGVAGEEEVV